MREEIEVTAQNLITEATKILKEKGLEKEELVLRMTRVASDLIWGNADPDSDKDYKTVDWVTELENRVVDGIIALHRKRIIEYLNTNTQKK